MDWVSSTVLYNFENLIHKPRHLKSELWPVLWHSNGLICTKMSNKVVADITAATDTTLTKIGRQSAESVNTPTVAVVTIAKNIVRDGLAKTVVVRAEVPVVTVNIVNAMNNIVTTVTEATTAVTAETTVLAGRERSHAMFSNGYCVKDRRDCCCI